jgi:hypothetical protein
MGRTWSSFDAATSFSEKIARARVGEHSFFAGLGNYGVDWGGLDFGLLRKCQENL